MFVLFFICKSGQLSVEQLNGFISTLLDTVLVKPALISAVTFQTRCAHKDIIIKSAGAADDDPEH